MTRKRNDMYVTPLPIIEALLLRWPDATRRIWEPCQGDGRFAAELRARGHRVIAGDIETGQDFFSLNLAPVPVLATNPPFSRIRDFIDHAFDIGVQEMALVCPERLWACKRGREQYRRHKPHLWANLDWREDYLGKGGSPDRALAVAIWRSPCAITCEYQIWGRP